MKSGLAGNSSCFDLSLLRFHSVQMFHNAYNLYHYILYSYLKLSFPILMANTQGNSVMKLSEILGIQEDVEHHCLFSAENNIIYRIILGLFKLYDSKKCLMF